MAKKKKKGTEIREKEKQGKSRNSWSKNKKNGLKIKQKNISDVSHIFLIPGYLSQFIFFRPIGLTNIRPLRAFEFAR